MNLKKGNYLLLNRKKLAPEFFPVVKYLRKCSTFGRWWAEVFYIKNKLTYETIIWPEKNLILKKLPKREAIDRITLFMLGAVKEKK